MHTMPLPSPSSSAPMKALLRHCLRVGIGTPRRRSTVNSTEPATRKRMRSEEHTSELQSLMRISYAVFCLKKKRTTDRHRLTTLHLWTHNTETTPTHISRRTTSSAYQRLQVIQDNLHHTN